MARRLVAFVFVDGEWFGPDDRVPPGIAKKIGDHAWTDADQDAAAEVEQPVGGQSVGRQSGGDVESPPRSGRGSGRDAWVAFAEASGLDVDADRSREQIIADLEERGVIEREE